MSTMQVTRRNIVDIARKCRGEVRASDAVTTRGILFIQVDACKSKYKKNARAYVGDTIIPREDGFDIVRSGEAPAV